MAKTTKKEIELRPVSKRSETTFETEPIRVFQRKRKLPGINCRKNKSKK